MNPVTINKSTELSTVTLPETPASPPKVTVTYPFPLWFRAVALPFRLAWGALLVGVGVLAAFGVTEIRAHWPQYDWERPGKPSSC